MTKILTIAIVLGAALLMGCSGGTKEAAQPTALATSAAPTVVPVAATAVRVVPTAVPVAPKATPQDSALYVACVASYSDLTADSSWVKCLCNYINNHYTMAQFKVGKDFTAEEAAAIEKACGQPSDLQ